LQLFIEKSDGTLQNPTLDNKIMPSYFYNLLFFYSEENSNISLFVAQCDLYSEDTKENRGHVYNPSSANASSLNGTYIIMKIYTF
jgi:hypothetical protein